MGFSDVCQWLVFLSVAIGIAFMIVGHKNMSKKTKSAAEQEREDIEQFIAQHE